MKHVHTAWLMYELGKQNGIRKGRRQRVSSQTVPHFERINWLFVAQWLDYTALENISVTAEDALGRLQNHTGTEVLRPRRQERLVIACCAVLKSEAPQHILRQVRVVTELDL